MISADLQVDFPLRGEWWATNTPAHRVPSHGTDYFAQRYAFDFVRMDASGTWYYPDGPSALLRHGTVGIAADRFHAWDQPVYSAFAGRVVLSADGWPDRRRVVLPWELVRPGPGPTLRGDDVDYRPLTGNLVIVEGADGVALYAHLRQGSIRIREGQRVAAGELLGAVGNSGNSSMPHLHFHMMDDTDPLSARPLACAFERYELWIGSGWRTIENGIPGHFERIRVL